MMYAKMEKIDDILKLLHCGNPKRITFDLAEDGISYNAKIYIDIVDKSKDAEYEGYIECKTSLNAVVSYPLVYSHEDKNAEIFTITIPDMDE